MATSSRIKLRGLDLSSRHELLAKSTDLDQEVLQALRPEHGLSLDQADHMIERGHVGSAATRHHRAGPGALGHSLGSPPRFQ